LLLFDFSSQVYWSRNSESVKWTKKLEKNNLNLSEQIQDSKISKLQKDKENGIHVNVLVGKPERKRPLGDPDVDGRIILRWIFRK
jgi:hypothetical protein